MVDLTNFRDTLGRVQTQSHDDAMGLPGVFYSDPAVTEIERLALFHEEWICVGRVEEIPQKGDYFTFDLCGEPLIVVRGRDGEIRALANVCRHRGAKIVEGSGNTRAFLCPYHHWGYDTTGKLTAAPHIEASAGFDPSNCRLPESPLVEWRGFLFVSLASEPPPLLDRLRTLDALIAPYHLEEMRLRFVTEEVWDTNWKCLMENFMEGYHLSPLHRHTLHKVNPTRLCAHLPPGPLHFGYSVGFEERIAGSERGHAGLTDEQRRTCIMAAIPPGFAMGIGSDYSSFLSMRPEGPGQVRAKMGLYFHGDDWADVEVDRAVRLFEETMAEDKAVLIGLQQGLGSKFHAPGPLAPRDMEGTILDFHKYLADRLSKAV